MKTHTPPDIALSIDPFGLARLPTRDAPDNGWPAVELALKRHRPVRRSLVWLASAATVALAAGLYLQFPAQWAGGDRPIATSPSNVATGVPARASARPQDDVLALIALSQQLEKNLRLVRAEAGAMPAQSLVYQVELEDLVTQLDEAISQSPDSRALWSQRVNLLLDLNQLYQVQLRRDYRHVASL